MRNTIILFLLLLTGITAFGKGDGKGQNREKITAMLAKQVEEWNNGNAEGYMVGYWNDDSLLFIGKNGPTYGYKATLERYQKSYPDAKAMGKLTSTILSLKKLSDEYFFVVGKWELKREAGDLSGSYTLLIKEIKGKWVIVSDHSS
jgi:hypothetical protein